MFSFNRCLSAGIVCTGLYASQTNQQPEMANKLAAVKAINAEISLASKRCVVVGGTSGIGHGVALRLARAGCSVTIVGRKERGIVEEMKAISPDGVECSHSFMYVASSTCRQPLCLNSYVSRLSTLVPQPLCLKLCNCNARATAVCAPSVLNRSNRSIDVCFNADVNTRMDLTPYLWYR